MSTTAFASGMRFRRKFAQRTLVRGKRFFGGVAAKAWKGVKALRRVSNAEIKTAIVNSSTTPSTTTAFIRLSGTAQGDDLSNRQGRSIRVVSWKLLYEIRTNGGNVPLNPTSVRMLIFADNGQDGVVPTDAEVRNSTDIVSLMNPTNAKRFTPIIDRLITVGPGTAATAGAATTRAGRLAGTAKGIWGKHVRYIGTTDAQGSDGLGSLYMLLQSGETGDDLPLVLFNFEMKFADN